MSGKTGRPPEWQQQSLSSLAALSSESIAGLEILYLDGIAAYAMSSGTLEPPFTIEHGSEVVSLLLSAVANSRGYEPERIPATTTDMIEAREKVVLGAHAFADRGVSGLDQLVNRLVSAAVGELEVHKSSSEHQVRSLFFYGLVAVASGPSNLLNESAAAGVMGIFHAWDDLIGDGFVPPWRVAAAD